METNLQPPFFGRVYLWKFWGIYIQKETWRLNQKGWKLWKIRIHPYWTIRRMQFSSRSPAPQRNNALYEALAIMQAAILQLAIWPYIDCNCISKLYIVKTSNEGDLIYQNKRCNFANPKYKPSSIVPEIGWNRLLSTMKNLLHEGCHGTDPRDLVFSHGLRVISQLVGRWLPQLYLLMSPQLHPFGPRNSVWCSFAARGKRRTRPSCGRWQFPREELQLGTTWRAWCPCRKLGLVQKTSKNGGPILDIFWFWGEMGSEMIFTHFPIPSGNLLHSHGIDGP